MLCAKNFELLFTKENEQFRCRIPYVPRGAGVGNTYATYKLLTRFPSSDFAHSSAHVYTNEETNQ